jgi:hypothetical protein
LADERPEFVHFHLGHMQVTDEKVGHRVDVLADPPDPRRDGFVIVTSLLLSGAQATSMQHHVDRTDDLRRIRLGANERGSERLPE